MIKKTKSGYKVTTKSGGRTLGKHKSKKEAYEQLKAIEASKKRKGKKKTK